MNAMYAAFAAMIVITVGAWYGLGMLGFSSGERLAGDNVRLSAPAD
ncbi:hypothetical protein [Roseovarius salinarum]|nr:hypothetical protein [Roseovarius salinarum]